MPQCKLSNCREQAVPVGKRYCPTHLAEYRAKQKAAAERRKTMPKCACGEVAMRDQERCRTCDEEHQEQLAEYEKMASFERASTVEELKDWIRTYVLD